MQTTPGEQDIVVQGVNDRKSAWRRAESDHVIVIARGSDAELRRITTGLERLYYTMSMVYRRPPTLADNTVKMQVVLVGSGGFFGQMGLRNLRAEEGPFTADFARQRYYDPREDGEVLVVASIDQSVNVDVNKVFNDFNDDFSREVVDGTDSLVSEENSSTGPSLGSAPDPLSRPWEAVLYSAFAQHYVLTYYPAAYPRWYLDAVGALFSTVDVWRDGKITYGRPPSEYDAVLRTYIDLKLGDVLTGKYLTGTGAPYWTPYHAWLLAHYFTFGNKRPERRAQYMRYMQAVNRGVPQADAAKVFGDLKQLNKDIFNYARGNVQFARFAAPKALPADPVIDTLSRTSAAVLDARIELATRVTLPLADAAPAVRAAALKRRDAWLAALRQKVAGLPYNRDAILLLAEAECRSDAFAACRAAAEQVIDKDPRNVRALAWKGIALTQLALTASAEERPALLITARKTIAQANKIDNDAPLPLLAYFQSYTAAGQPAPPLALRAMEKVIESVPAAPAPRLMLAQELVRQGQPGAARRIVGPVLYGGYESPEKQAAQALVPQLPAPVPVPVPAADGATPAR